MKATMKKIDLAKAIENHHLYEPQADGVYSKNYYRYNPWTEIKILTRNSKRYLQDMYDNLYGDDGRELTASEIIW